MKLSLDALIIDHSAMDKSQGIVYMVTHLGNGKRYIGATTLPLDARWAFHISHSQKQMRSPFHRALRASGAAKFKIVQLASCLRLEELAELETQCIYQHDPEYNVALPEDIWSGTR